MLVWEANFQIPNSGIQSKYVFLTAEKTESSTILYFYSDESCINLLWNEETNIPDDVKNIYEYLLTMEEYKNYKRV